MAGLARRQLLQLASVMRASVGAADADGKFPCDNLSDEANLGHDLFYGRNDSGLNVPLARNAGCSACHNNKGPSSDGNEPDQVYSDFAYHSIALPFNRRLNGNVEGADPGLFAHDDLPGNVAGLGDEGLFKTPTLRNATKNERGITKAFMHNGYFKSIEDVVHFYNTRFDGTLQDTVDPNPPDQPQKTVCEDDPGIEDATAAEAIANDCWPVPEFPGTALALGGLFGNLGLTRDQEAALVAYIQEPRGRTHAYGAQHGQVIVDTPRRRFSRGGQIGLPFFFAHPAQPRTDCRPGKPTAWLDGCGVLGAWPGASPQRTKSTSCSAERRIASSMSVRSWSASNSSLQLAAGDTQNSARVGARRIVVVGVGHAHRHAHQIARPRLDLGLAELQVERALQHVDELVLPRMDVQRHERAGRIEGLEAEAARAVRLQEIAVAQHVPADLVLTGTRPR